MIQLDEFIRIRNERGEELAAYCNPEKLEAHLLSLSPADKKPIRELVNAVRHFKKFDLSVQYQKPRDRMNARDWQAFGQKMMPFMGDLAKWAQVSAEEYSQRFTNPFLKRAIPLMFGWPEIPMMAAIAMLAYMDEGNAAFPEGGSLELARSIESRYKELGGQLFYESQVANIIVKEDSAVGVHLYDDREFFADHIISAADGHGTIFDMLGGKYVNRQIKKFYDGSFPIHSQLQISLGVNRDLCNEPAWVIHLFDEPFVFLTDHRNLLSVKNFCFDPTLAPKGKSVLEMFLRYDYDYFHRIYGRRIYDAEQDQLADQAIDQLQRIYPAIRKEIEVIDVATPMSYERYTGNWQGSSCGWLLTKKTMRYNMFGMLKTLPGLNNFHMAGQWVEPGGSVALCAASGRNAIQSICAQDGISFTSPG
jgi:phytoene dehydrogenase-like protein